MQLAYVFWNRIIKIKRFPKKVILNKNKLFILIYQKIIITKLGIKLKLLIVYYLKINKQIKKVNTILKIYLRY